MRQTEHFAGKFLTLLRHAKSDWNVPGLSDHDRPLNARGRHAAPLMGGLMGSEWIQGKNKRGPLPPLDGVFCSTAVRARETAALLLPTAGLAISPITYDKELYMASKDRLLEFVRNLPDNLRHVMMVGHNEGMEDFVQALAPRHRAPGAMPTCSLAFFHFKIEHWASVEEGSGELLGLLRPREVLK